MNLAVSEPLSILAVTNMWPTVQDPSAGIFVYEQISDLRSSGFNVDVVHFDGRSSKTEYVRAIRRIRTAIEAGRYDVVHAHYGLTGLAAMLAHSKPLITTFHG